jgi:hypothetical protein
MEPVTADPFVADLSAPLAETQARLAALEQRLSPTAHPAPEPQRIRIRRRPRLRIRPHVGTVPALAA